MVPDEPLPLQRLLEIRGFLMYVVRTYAWMNPYIKGLHLTIHSWRLGRADDGFRWSAKERQAHLELPCWRANEGWEEQLGVTEEEAPKTVLPVDRYLRDLACLQNLTAQPEPPKQLYRASRQVAFLCGG